jgi:hypothetical protein
MQRAPQPLPKAALFGLNAGVPTLRSHGPSGTIAPKSINLAAPSRVQRTLRGLMSRCTSRRECNSASDEQTCIMSAQAAPNASGARVLRSPPSSSSIV